MQHNFSARTTAGVKLRLIVSLLTALCLAALVGPAKAATATALPTDVNLMAYSNQMTKMVYLHNNFYGADQHANVRYGANNFTFPISLAALQLDPTSHDLASARFTGKTLLLNVNYSLDVTIQKYALPGSTTVYWMMKICVKNVTKNTCLISDQVLFNTFVYKLK